MSWFNISIPQNCASKKMQKRPKWPLLISQISLFLEKKSALSKFLCSKKKTFFFACIALKLLLVLDFNKQQKNGSVSKKIIEKKMVQHMACEGEKKGIRRKLVTDDEDNFSVFCFIFMRIKLCMGDTKKKEGRDNKHLRQAVLLFS